MILNCSAVIVVLVLQAPVLENFYNTGYSSEIQSRNAVKDLPHNLKKRARGN